MFSNTKNCLLKINNFKMYKTLCKRTSKNEEERLNVNKGSKYVKCNHYPVKIFQFLFLFYFELFSNLNHILAKENILAYFSTK